jgi:hypothetical protein
MNEPTIFGVTVSQLVTLALILTGAVPRIWSLFLGMCKALARETFEFLEWFQKAREAYRTATRSLTKNSSG